MILRQSADRRLTMRRMLSVNIFNTVFLKKLCLLLKFVFSEELVSVKLSMLPNDASQRKVQRAIVELIDNALEAAEQGNNKASDDA